ncbi:hypothetical protein CLOM621_08639 [Clostridium sp. M62/1]|nr:hypothetical protein CLOM621_08639 [Clostridium sp. M62/1]
MQTVRQYRKTGIKTAKITKPQAPFWTPDSSAWYNDCRAGIIPAHTGFSMYC